MVVMMAEMEKSKIHVPSSYTADNGTDFPHLKSLPGDLLPPLMRNESYNKYH